METIQFNSIPSVIQGKVNQSLICYTTDWEGIQDKLCFNHQSRVPIAQSVRAAKGTAGVTLGVEFEDPLCTEYTIRVSNLVPTPQEVKNTAIISLNKRTNSL